MNNGVIINDGMNCIFQSLDHTVFLTDKRR
jgi:hypothetical protein